VTLAQETERYLGLYRTMVLIRGFEDLIQSPFLRSEIYLWGCVKTIRPRSRIHG
jgi:hypothetical protein